MREDGNGAMQCRMVTRRQFMLMCVSLTPTQGGHPWAGVVPHERTCAANAQVLSSAWQAHRPPVRGGAWRRFDGPAV